MNRREFFGTVGAVSVTVYFAGLPAVTVASSIPVNLLPWYTQLYPWQQRLWDALENGKQVMYVTSTQYNARHTFNLFQRHKNLFTTSIHGSIVGRRANLIIMDDFNDDMDEDWFNCAIRTRLYPKGQIDWVYTP